MKVLCTKRAIQFWRDQNDNNSSDSSLTSRRTDGGNNYIYLQLRYEDTKLRLIWIQIPSFYSGNLIGRVGTHTHKAAAPIFAVSSNGEEEEEEEQNSSETSASTSVWLWKNRSLLETCMVASSQLFAPVKKRLKWKEMWHRQRLGVVMKFVYVFCTYLQIYITLGSHS